MMVLLLVAFFSGSDYFHFEALYKVYFWFMFFLLNPCTYCVIFFNCNSVNFVLYCMQECSTLKFLLECNFVLRRTLWEGYTIFKK